MNHTQHGMATSSVGNSTVKVLFGQTDVDTRIGMLSSRPSFARYHVEINRYQSNYDDYYFDNYY